jgi:hypothetical protein
MGGIGGGASSFSGFAVAAGDGFKRGSKSLVSLFKQLLFKQFFVSHDISFQGPFKKPRRRGGWVDSPLKPPRWKRLGL